MTIRPHLAFLTTELSTGGVGRLILNLMDTFCSRGHPVDLLVKHASGPYLEGLDQRVHVVELKTTHAYFCLPRLTTYLLRRRPAVMFTDRRRTAIAALRACRLSRVETRICTSVHIPLSYKLNRLSPSQQRKEFTATRRFYPMLDGIIAVSNGVSKDLVDNFGLSKDRIRAVYNPVVTSNIRSLAREAVSHPWFDSKEVPIILGAGRFTAQKGFPYLMRAFAKLNSRRRCRLVILGQGKQRSELEALAVELGIDDRVSLPGFVTNPYKYMARAQLFVLSSAWEGFGNVLAEAMAVGLPVVSTDCDYGPKEILQQGRFGALVPVGDVDALATAMENTLDNPLPSRILKQAASRFTAEACADGYLAAAGYPSSTRV